MTWISDAELLRQFDAMSAGAFRLETRRQYALGYEQPVLEQFMAGQTPDMPDWYEPWLDQVATDVRDGKTYRRVRLIDDPPTDYQRYNMWAGRWNAAAGEDLLYVSRTQAVASGIPDDTDWWLFDDDTLVLMHFTDTGDIADRKLITAPAVVGLYRDWRDRATSIAVHSGELAA